MVAQTRLTVTLYVLTLPVLLYGRCLSCYTVTLVVHSKRQTAPQVRYKHVSIS